MVERKHEDPWGEIKQLNFPHCAAIRLAHWMEKVKEHYSKISLKQDVQHLWDMTSSKTTQLRPVYLWPDRVKAKASRCKSRLGMKDNNWFYRHNTKACFSNIILDNAQVTSLPRAHVHGSILQDLGLPNTIHQNPTKIDYKYLTHFTFTYMESHSAETGPSVHANQNAIHTDPICLHSDHIPLTVFYPCTRTNVF